ncbi:MAG: hypothetical protein KGN76_14550 [Acidobacteriota bacterium]|nr:hypothetical protein [Acidobacteriota bacterium]
MVIKASASREISQLLDDLTADHDVRREAAVARLTVIGPRAVDRLVALLETAPPAGRAAALRALGAIGDARALAPALACLEASDTAVAVAAAGVAGGFLQSAGETRALARLTDVALDRTRDRRVRLAALLALEELPPDTLQPIRDQLRRDPDPILAAHAAGDPLPEDTGDPIAALESAAAGRLPRDPAIVRAWLQAAAATVPLPTVHRLIGALRDREAAGPAPVRPDWLAVRALAHQVLGGRGSRVAVYDLRETLEGAEGSLPREFMAAVAAVGDASCLEPLAAAYVRATAAGPALLGSWPGQLVDTFRAVLRRERITRRHAAVKRIEARWPAAARTLFERA